MRKAIFGLGFFLVIACSGKSEPDPSESGSAAASGEDASGGGSGEGRGGGPSSGSTGEGGASAGAATGGSPNGGSAQGGSTSGGSGGSSGDGMGEGGEAGGTAGTASETGGMATAGSGGQAGGTGGSGTPDAVCDPATGELETTPYPDCEPRDPSDACELCIQAACCAESKTCYGYDPGNVCGWGGPSGGTYAGLNEIDCYVACVHDYVREFGAYDDATDNGCIPACTTGGCGLIGNATQDLVVCMRSHCDDECFIP